uniref:Dienelactone hydrolase domain-containing protein n=1 Tax=Chromera velia CCMP2878 TaxID=1169474 RepID=A0A0G4I0T9_9ALVE|eukprot:Cvel_10033.t1-p1 / transcript=Cvel_10033.t1 / gene=Cvel_10033 / organism=Chromera_velia_CCMP2878 / gene_product=hypothetical protein / transcript_product=hypothetical protein / location=Cvel_scaffold596:52437-54181(-) / protein_length=298 / sequence_SO=supercontig / SO=protein_coding / is_pseudo=false
MGQKNSTDSAPVAACCPPDSEPPRTFEYEPKGGWSHAMESGDGDGPSGSLSVYSVGETAAPYLVLVLPDIFGVNSGRTVEICDIISSKMNFRVVLMDPFDGSPYAEALQPKGFTFLWTTLTQTIPFVKKHTWEKVAPKIFSVIKASASEMPSLKGVFLVGFCWGTWANFKLCQSPSVAEARLMGAVNFHPSFIVEKVHTSMFSSNDMKLCEGLQVPQLICTAGNDAANTKTGGQMDVHLKSRAPPLGEVSEVRTWEGMIHGWVNRRDPNDEKAVREADEALESAIAFMQKILESEKKA